MGSIDDSSLISGISNISRISKINNSTQHKFDSSNVLEWQSINPEANKSFITKNQKKNLQKSSESIKFCKTLSSYEESTCNFAKLKFIYECLENIAEDQNSSLKKTTQEKLKNYLMVHEVKNYINLPNNSKTSKDELTLLGIIDLPTFTFTYEEQIEIKCCLETKLREKLHTFITIFENYAGSVSKIFKNNDSLLISQFQQNDNLKSLHWKDKIDEVCLGYKKSLDDCTTSLKQYNDQKARIFNKTTKDSENLLLRAEVAEMKSIITKLTCSIRLFKETPMTIEAYKILNNSLDDKIIGVSEKINKKIELKKNYDDLKNTEYDGILSKYLELCNVIEKKKMLLEKL